MPPRDAQATKHRILRAAFAEFTKRGFAGARVDGIAGRARVNKALLYQYYGDKEALFRNVLESKLAELGSLRADPDRLPEVAGDFFDFYASNPWLARLVMWEALDYGTKPVCNETERQQHFAEHVDDLRRAQRAGFVDPRLDPQHALFTLVGLVVFWFAAPQVARMISGGDPYSPEALKRRRAHVVDVARRILEVR